MFDWGPLGERRWEMKRRLRGGLFILLTAFFCDVQVPEGTVLACLRKGYQIVRRADSDSEQQGMLIRPALVKVSTQG